LRRALGYKRLRDRISPEQARDVLENIEAAAIIVESVGQVTFSSDPDDNLMLATAIAARGDLIVSGDKLGMLSLGELEGNRAVGASGRQHSSLREESSYAALASVCLLPLYL
jgi:predicted nucleic acid-binding protein